MTETVLLTFVGDCWGSLSEPGGFRFLEVLGADRLPLAAHIVSMAGWRRSVSLALWFSGIVIAVPIAWLNLSTHLAHTLQSDRAPARLVAPRNGFATDSSSAQIALAFVLLAAPRSSA